MRSNIGVVAAVLLAAFSVSASAKQQASTTYQINLAHDGNIRMKGFVPPLKILWKTDLSGFKALQVTSYPIIADNRVFVVSDVQSIGAELFALDLATGAILWKVPVPQGLEQVGGIAYDNGILFLTNSEGLMQAYSPADGSVLWTHQLPGTVAITFAPPIATDGLVFQSAYTFGGHLYALDEATGNVVWDNYTNNEGLDRTIPAIGKGSVFVTYTCWYYKFDEMTGTPLYYVGEGGDGGGGSTPVLWRKDYYVRDHSCLNDGRILEANDGKQIGAFNSYVAPVIWSDSLGDEYQIGRKWEDPVMYAYDRKTGKLPWQFTGDGGLEMPPIVINKNVVAISHTGMLYFLNGKTGELKWSTDIGSAVYFDELGGEPLGGLGAGYGTLVIPTGDSVIALVPQTQGPSIAAGNRSRSRDNSLFSSGVK